MELMPNKFPAPSSLPPLPRPPSPTGDRICLPFGAKPPESFLGFQFATHILGVCMFKRPGTCVGGLLPNEISFSCSRRDSRGLMIETPVPLASLRCRRRPYCSGLSPCKSAVPPGGWPLCAHGFPGTLVQVFKRPPVTCPENIRGLSGRTQPEMPRIFILRDWMLSRQPLEFLKHC